MHFHAICGRARVWASLCGTLGLVFSWSSGAAAQTDQAAAVVSTPTLSEVTVTGTRIARPNLTSDVPITTVSRQDIEERGELTLDVVLNRLPQVVPSYSSAANNPSANGASYVNLRGLGVSRNLVLVDGRRVVGANASSSVDLNTIPTPLIERVEVITGGASAVYGPDAVAGVVNIILKKTFDGFEASARTLVSEHGDGQEHELAVTFGHSFSRGALSGTVGWSERDAIGKGARDFTAQADSGSGALPNGSYLVSGANLPTLAAINKVFASYGVPAGAVSVRGGIGGFSFNTDGTLIATGQPGNSAFDAQNYRGSLATVATRIYPDVYSYNFQPDNKLILPLERVSGLVMGNWDLGSNVTIYGQAMGTHYTASTSLASTPAPTDVNPLYPGLGVAGFTIPVTNPFIPPDLRTLLASRTGDSPSLPGAGPNEDFQYRFRAVAVGPRQSTNTNDTFNLTAGLKFDLWGDWRGDVYGTWGQYNRSELQQNLVYVRRFEQLMYSPTGGTEFCDGGFNPFGGTMSDSCRKFLQASIAFSTRIEQDNEAAIFTGTVLELPAGPVKAVVGVEHRHISYAFTPPSGIGSLDIAGFTNPGPLVGVISANDLFTEVAVPLMVDEPLAHSLDMTLGFRRGAETGSGAANSYKVELSWSPAEPVRFRGSFQQAVRSPDILERYGPPTAADAPAHDPCASNNPARTAAILTLCQKQAAAMGFLPGYVDTTFVEDEPNPSVTVVNSSNPHLASEQARTLTLGVVWQPAWTNDWIGRVHATLDWYNIAIDNAIGFRDPQVFLAACYNLNGGNPTLDPASPTCSGLVRSTTDFSIAQIQTPQSNQARLDIAGIDTSVTFRTDLAAISGHAWLGHVETDLSLGWLQRFEQQDSPLQRTIDYAGTISEANFGYESLPVWKGLLDFTWVTGPVRIATSGRYISSMIPRNRRFDPTDTTSTGVGAAWYWDLFGQWTIGHQVELRGGVINLFDRPPELYTPSVDANTDPSTYDVIGRRFWIGLTLRL
jgi:iron complex outermembrane recepter protein